MGDDQERRQGHKIAAKGIYRDAARSSRSVFVKSQGLRWISMMLLAPIPWAGRVWALPFLTVLAPSERYDAQRDRRHKTLARWAGQMMAQVRRWLPDRLMVLVADGGYSVLTLLDRCLRLHCGVTMVTRLRLDAALYEPAPPRRPGQVGRPRLKGKRLPNLSAVVEDPAIAWTPIAVRDWYGEGVRVVEIATATAVWYSTRLYALPLRWTLVRDPRGAFAPPKPCFAPTLTPIRSESSPGSSCAGRWKQPFRKHVGTSESRASGSGRIWRSNGPHQRCWVCSRSSRSWRISG